MGNNNALESDELTKQTVIKNIDSKLDDENESILSERKTLVDLKCEINNMLNRTFVKSKIESSRTSQCISQDVTDQFSSLNTVQQFEENQKQMQKYEADIRNHISVEQQLQIYIETLKDSLEDLQNKHEAVLEEHKNFKLKIEIYKEQKEHHKNQIIIKNGELEQLQSLLIDTQKNLKQIKQESNQKQSQDEMKLKKYEIEIQQLQQEKQELQKQLNFQKENDSKLILQNEIKIPQLRKIETIDISMSKSSLNTKVDFKSTLQSFNKPYLQQSMMNSDVMDKQAYFEQKHSSNNNQKSANSISTSGKKKTRFSQQISPKNIEKTKNSSSFKNIKINNLLPRDIQLKEISIDNSRVNIKTTEINKNQLKNMIQQATILQKNKKTGFFYKIGTIPIKNHNKSMDMNFQQLNNKSLNTIQDSTQKYILKKDILQINNQDKRKSPSKINQSSSLREQPIFKQLQFEEKKVKDKFQKQVNQLNQSNIFTNKDIDILDKNSPQKYIETNKNKQKLIKNFVESRKSLKNIDQTSLINLLDIQSKVDFHNNKNDFYFKKIFELQSKQLNQEGKDDPSFQVQKLKTSLTSDKKKEQLKSKSQNAETNYQAAGTGEQHVNSIISSQIIQDLFQNEQNSSNPEVMAALNKKPSLNRNSLIKSEKSKKNMQDRKNSEYEDFQYQNLDEILKVNQLQANNSKSKNNKLKSTFQNLQSQRFENKTVLQTQLQQEVDQKKVNHLRSISDLNKIKNIFQGIGKELSSNSRSNNQIQNQTKQITKLSILKN